VQVKEDTNTSKDDFKEQIVNVYSERIVLINSFMQWKKTGIKVNVIEGPQMVAETCMEGDMRQIWLITADWGVT
jgi:hypothetical protein